jgi:hypothetical protein
MRFVLFLTALLFSKILSAQVSIDADIAIMVKKLNSYRVAAGLALAITPA